MKNTVIASLQEAQAALNAMLENTHLLETIVAAADALAQMFRSGGTVFSCGNGGSMCDAMHFAEELSGRYRLDRRALGAIAISDPSFLTCAANDYGYERAFSRFIEGVGRSCDILLAISTSGSSESVINAVKVAKAQGMKVIGLHGRPGSRLSELSDYDICTPAGQFADRVQECHIKVIHIMIDLVERGLFPGLYK